MAMNKVQFQKGLSEQRFDKLYGTEEQCRAVVIAVRWPNGFECPACGGTVSVSYTHLVIVSFVTAPVRCTTIAERYCRVATYTT